MASNVMNLINSSFAAAGSWFSSIFNASGMVEIYLAMIFITLCFKFILTPIFGISASSDRVVSSYKKQSKINSSKVGGE